MRRNQCRALQAIRCGRIALAWWPFHFEPTESANGIIAPPPAQQKQAFIGSDSPCRLCHEGVETPLHLIVACQHEEMQHFRRWLFKQTKHLLARMDKLIKSAFQVRVYDSASAARAKETTMPTALQEALVAVAAATKVASPSSNDSRVVMFRLMACAPWSAYDVREADADTAGGGAHDRSARAQARERRRSTQPAEPTTHPGLPLALAIGKMLDSLAHKRSRLRPWANLWTLWSYRAVMRLTTMHGCALGIAKAMSSCPVHGNTHGRATRKGHNGRNSQLGPDPHPDIDDSDAWSDASLEEEPSDPAASV